MAAPTPFEESIDAFSEDMFQYLLPRRIDVSYDSNRVPRPPNVPKLFRPEYGMAVLCESHRKQGTYIDYFASQYKTIVADTRAYMTFVTHYGFELVSQYEGREMEAMITVASMILELGVFCHHLGYPKFKYYSGICWSDIFKYFIAHNFFKYYSWDDLLDYVQDDVEAYKKGNYEVQLEGGGVELRIDWLKTLDYSVSVFTTFFQDDKIFAINEPRDDAVKEFESTETPDAEFEELDDVPAISEMEKSSGDSKNDVPGVSEVKGLEDAKNAITEEISSIKEKTAETSETTVDTKDETPETSEIKTGEESKDLSAEKPLFQVSTQREAVSVKSTKPQPKIPKTDGEVIAEFKRLIWQGEDPCLLLEVLEERKTMRVLMRSNLFLKVAREMVERGDRMENKDILEFAKLVIMGNEDLARFFIQATRYITLSKSIGTLLSKTAEDSEFTIQNTAAALSELNVSLPSDKASTENLGAIPKRRKRSAVKAEIPLEPCEKLFNEFMLHLSQFKDNVGLKLYNILSSGSNKKIAMDNNVYRSIMALTLKFPVRRWGNSWILSFTKSLIDLSTGQDVAQKTDIIQSGDEVRRNTEGNIVRPEASDDLSQIPPDEKKNLQNPADTASHLFEFDNEIYVLDSETDTGDSDNKTVYIDVVNLRHSLKHLIVDTLKEQVLKPVDSKGSESETPRDNPKRRRRNRKRSKRQKSEESEGSAATESKTVEQETERPVVAETAGEIVEQETEKPVVAETAGEIVEQETERPVAAETADKIVEQQPEKAKGETLRQKTEKPEGKLAGETAVAGTSSQSAAHDEKSYENRETADTSTREMDQNANMPEGISRDSENNVIEGETVTSTTGTGFSATGGTETDNSEEQCASASDESASDIKKMLELIPGAYSEQILNWIFDQVLAGNPNFFDSLKDKNLDEDTMNLFMKYKDRFYGKKK